jgi:beta-xylosidase
MKSPGLFLILALIAPTAFAAGSGLVASKPLYRDPVYDGAADPVLIWNPQVKRWWMFYTNRRANVPGLSGVTWVHGTPIGIAESADGGATWKYVGTARFDLPPESGGTNITCWAPDVTRAPDGTWQMFLTVVPGIFEDWNHPRDIVQLTSTNLLHWTDPRKLSLASDRVIDPSIERMPDGTWRLYYNNERAGKSINYADSPDLATWTDKGLAFKSRGEGPKGFRWHNQYWVIIDEWKGLGVFRSDDASNWEKQPVNLLAQPGKGEDDQVIGGHPDVVVSGDRAFLFYFTHPGRRGADARKDTHEQRRSSIQAVELELKDGWLACDRDQPTHVALLPPQ